MSRLRTVAFVRAHCRYQRTRLTRAARAAAPAGSRTGIRRMSGQRLQTLIHRVEHPAAAKDRSTRRYERCRLPSVTRNRIGEDGWSFRISRNDPRSVQIASLFHECNMNVILTDRLLQALSSAHVYFTTDGRHRINTGDIIHFNENIRLEPYCALLSGHALPSIGSFSYSWSSLQAGMDIGRYCSISWDLSIIAGNHPTNFISTSSFTYDSSFVIFAKALANRHFERYPQVPSRPNRNDLPAIGHDVWIGQSATLARGISLGTGCVVGAGSVVTKSVPPYAVVAGNPARMIRMRFPDSLVERLLGSEWWKYNFVDFATMRYNNPDRFLDELEAAVATNEISPFSPAVFTASELLHDYA